MANNLLTFKVSDSDPKAVYTLYNVNTGDEINMHSPSILPWLKFSKWNSSETLFTILGTKTNGGFDGQVQYRFVNPTTGISLIEDFDIGNYQGEIFISTSSFYVDLTSVDEAGLFTTSIDHNFATGDKIWISNVPELDELSVTEFTITVLSNDTFTIDEDWTEPDALTVFASTQVFNMRTTETAIHNAAILLKGEST